MSVRTELQQAIEAGLTNVKVVATLANLGELDPTYTGVVQVIRTDVTPSTQQPQGAYINTFEVWLIDPHTDPEVVEDTLDALLDALLELFDDIGWLTWGKAERSMYSDSYHAWKLSPVIIGSARERNDS